jgi:hypothetical protein
MIYKLSEWKVNEEPEFITTYDYEFITVPQKMKGLLARIWWFKIKLETCL